MPESRWEIARAKIRHVVADRILHLDDTPHRIAFGVFLGFVVAWTPTIGLQMLIYLAVASLLRANLVSGIPPIWLTNPITAVPIYYINWRIGQLLLGEDVAPSEAAEAEIARRVAPAAGDGTTEGLLSAEFWANAWDSLLHTGTELWVGSLVVGVILGAAGYWVTYRGVIAFRKARAAREC